MEQPRPVAAGDLAEVVDRARQVTRSGAVARHGPDQTIEAAPDLGRVSRERWRALRSRLEPRRKARTLRTRFRRDPDAYLAALEQQACQPALPA